MLMEHFLLRALELPWVLTGGSCLHKQPTLAFGTPRVYRTPLQPLEPLYRSVWWTVERKEGSQGNVATEMDTQTAASSASQSLKSPPLPHPLHPPTLHHAHLPFPLLVVLRREQ